MELTPAAAGGANAVRELSVLARAQDVSGAGVAIVDKALEMQQVFAAELLQSMGIGVNLDIKA